jgi:hypothetical protein
MHYSITTSAPVALVLQLIRGPVHIVYSPAMEKYIARNSVFMMLFRRTAHASAKAFAVQPWSASVL